MLEPLRCPGCSTRFVLGAGRVRPGIRRAKCFRCDSVFSIEDAVARLLAPEPAPEPVPAPAANAFELFPESSPDLTPSLTLEDLQGVQDDLLDAPAAADAPYVAASGGFASAKDAIAQLMGSAPVVPAPVVRLGGRSAMDVEATLDALSTTLGGEPPPVPPAAPVEPPAEAPRKSDMSSTVKLTSEEIRIAMASAGEPKPAAPMASAPPRPEPLAGIPPAPLPDPAGQGPDLLKIQLEQETCNNVTIEQMTSWIEQGRVLEYHMVARQYSEHWIEASKVPALRPVFERVRRIRENLAEEAPKPAPEPPPVKRGLFSGLFGRN